MRKTLVTLLVVLPLGGLVALLAPNVDGSYSSGCACMAARDVFAHALDLSRGRLSSEEAVAQAFQKKFAIGAEAHVAFEKFRFGHSGHCYCYYDGKAATCQFLYEKNEQHQRGYQLTVNLDSGKRIAGIDVRRAYFPGTPIPAGQPVDPFTLADKLKDEASAKR